MSLDISAMQQDLRAAKFDGWLFYDFRGRDPIAKRILQLPDGMRTRRWFYFVPAKGHPKKLVHKIETAALESVPGDTLYYSGLDELAKNLKKALGRAKKVAMQYSPKNAIPYVSMVDAGPAEFAAAPGHAIDRIIQEAFAHAANCVRTKKPLTEYDLKEWMRKKFAEASITADD